MLKTYRAKLDVVTQAVVEVQALNPEDAALKVIEGAPGLKWSPAPDTYEVKDGEEMDAAECIEPCFEEVTPPAPEPETYLRDPPPVQPAPGVGATLGIGSDCYPYTISRVSPSGKTFWMRRDNYTRTDQNGMSESQEYDYSSDPNAPEEEVRMTTRGWRLKGSKYQSVHVGTRRAYSDPHR